MKFTTVGTQYRQHLDHGFMFEHSLKVFIQNTICASVKRWYSIENGVPPNKSMWTLPYMLTWVAT